MDNMARYVHLAGSAQDVDGMNLISTFAEMEVGDVWDDARLREAVVYCRGAKNLRIPGEWREVLPAVL